MTRRATLDGLDVQRPAVGGTKRRFRMRPTTKFLAVCGAIAGGLYVAYLMIFPTVYLRYRLTLDADVDGVTRTGSGVVEIAYQGMPDWLSEIGQGSHFGGVMRGYAITVDLGERGLLFVVDSPFLEDPTTHLLALPRLASLNMLPFVAYRLSQSYDPSLGLAAVRELQTKTGSVDLPPDRLPMVVRFRNIDDGNTIEELDPCDLAAAYGPGVLARARFEFTTDPVSPMPQTWPKWLASEEQRGFGFSYQHLWSFTTIWTDALRTDSFGRRRPRTWLASLGPGRKR